MQKKCAPKVRLMESLFGLVEALEILEYSSLAYQDLIDMGVSKNRDTSKWMLYNGNP